ncbi:MAG TPA: hypothetical protein VIT20_00660 [Propionibacteriaceae bacterium]
MRVETKDGGDGVRCWNVEAVKAYADGVNEKEQSLAQRNPDLVLVPGRLWCYGCEVMEYDYGIKCTAQLTHTLYTIPDEIAPRKADAAGSLGEIPGLATLAPPEVTVAAPATPEPSAAGGQGKRAGLRSLFGRPS